MSEPRIDVIGAGILGVWQALTLARAGHAVTVYDASETPFSASASRLAGAMLAPWCEAEAAPLLVRDLGILALEFWRGTFAGEGKSGIGWRGTLVVAPARDRSELARFARATTNYEWVDGDGLEVLEPELADRFPQALHFASEGFMDPRAALAHLLAEAEAAGARMAFGQVAPLGAQGTVRIDCRGIAARAELKDLRAVRGERLVVRAPDVHIGRCIRLLHPRHPIYVVPWADQHFMIGATVIESEDAGPVTVRSALELLSAAYALHPGFAEAEIVDMASGLRPAYADNVPRARVRGETIYVNGAFRHGFLLAPSLADAVTGWLTAGKPHPLLTVEALSP